MAAGKHLCEAPQPLLPLRIFILQHCIHKERYLHSGARKSRHQSEQADTKVQSHL